MQSQYRALRYSASRGKKPCVTHDGRLSAYTDTATIIGPNGKLSGGEEFLRCVLPFRYRSEFSVKASQTLSRLHSHSIIALTCIQFYAW